VLIIPVLDKPQSVDLRVKHQEVPHETCITQDNVQLDVDFVFYWKIQEPVWSITKVTDPDESIRLLATALLRAVIAHFKFNDVLNQRESINDLLKEKIDEISADWGVYVTTMEIREIKPPEEIVTSMHKQVSAEWQRKATVIEAEGTAQALKMLDEAAMHMDENTKSLKYYEMLNKLGEGSATKYIFPMELTNLAKGLSEKLDNTGYNGDTSKNNSENNLLDNPK
jgi:regulator of protease activity HflC (stomatin/prohibitin superfamily)